MKLWPYTLSGPDFLTAYTVAIVLAVLAWLLVRTRQRGVLRDRVVNVPLDAYQLAYLRGGAVAAVESALLALLLDGKVTRAGDRFAAVDGATTREGAPELERSVLAALTGAPRRCRELRSRVERELQRIDLLLVERGWIVPAGQRLGESLLAKLPLFGIGLAGVVRLVHGVEGGHPVGFLVFELLAVATLIAVLPRLPRRNPRGDAALAHYRASHDAMVRTATTAPAQLMPSEVAFSYALAGAAIGGVAGTALGWSRSRDVTCGSSAASGCGCSSTPFFVYCSSSSTSSCGASSGGDGGGSSCGGGGGCGGCGGGGD